MTLSHRFRGDIWSGAFRTRNWPVLAFGVVAVVLGLWGFSTCTAAECRTQGLGDTLFRTLDLVRMSSRYTPNKHPWPLVIAQLMMPLALAAGAIRLFILNMRRDLKVVMIRRLRDHVIVCGLGDTGLHIAQQLAAAGRRVVAISLDNEDAHALACERRGILVLRGDGLESVLLEVAGLHRSAALFVACGSDAVNIEVALRADETVGRRRRHRLLTIWIELRADWLYGTIADHRTRASMGGAATIRLFNLHLNAARSLLLSDAFAAALTQAGAAEELLLVGHGPALAPIAAQAMQGPLAVPGGTHTVTMLSDRADAVRAVLGTRYPGLLTMDGFAIEKADTIEAAAAMARLPQATPFAIVVELDDEVETMRVALAIRDGLDRHGRHATPVFARIWRQVRLGAYLRTLEGASGRPPRLATFGDLESLTTPAEMLAPSLDRLAIATHDVYRATPGNESAPAWADLPEAAKQSNRDFADHLSTKLRIVPIAGTPDPAAFERLAEMEHWRWSRALRIRGWRQGPRDPLGRSHPLLVDWSQLDEAARETNREMVRRIPQIVARAGED